MSQKKTIIQILLLLVINGTEAVIILSVTPESRNVSEGKIVEFYCATPDSGVTFSWIAVPNAGPTTTNVPDLPGGGKQSNLSFIATARHNNTLITCFAVKGTSGNHSTALLLVQGLLSPVGDLNSTEVDHCTLNFTWTAPYTLQGVPINFYNITITRRSNGTVLGQHTNITRRSNGTVLGQHTSITNTTEFLYNVSRLGETLEVVVAAVNDVGTGNSSNSSVSKPPFPCKCRDVKRSTDNWTYTFHIEGTFICSLAVDKIVIQKCSDTDNCKHTSGNVSMLSDGGRRVVATFTNLTENRIYSASALVHYDGGLVHHSQPVVVGTFDVQNITKPLVLNGQICFNISYVKGHKTPPRCFAKLTCGTLEYTQMITGTSGCINNVLPHESCNLTVTDGDNDAVHNINTAAPVTITGISVPSYTVAPSTTSITQTTTPTNPPTGTSDSPSTTVAIAVSISAVSAVLAIITVVVCMCGMIWKCYSREQNIIKPVNKRQDTMKQTGQTSSQQISELGMMMESHLTREDAVNTPNTEAATPTQQEVNYAVVQPRSAHPPAIPPPADYTVQYSEVLTNM